MKTFVLLLPGWQDSGPTHWQSRWAAQYGYARVQQHDWQQPLRGDWQARLDEVIANHVATANALPILELLTLVDNGLEPDLTPRNRTPDNAAQHHTNRAPAHIVLVAHSLGCHLVAAWASASRYTHAVRGALLVAPPDLTRVDLPPDLHNWRRPVLNKLPFPATCVISSNDPFASLAAGRAIAAAWGAGCIELGANGHINGDSGLGDWPAGHAMVLDLAGSQM
jgi:uncharacterized protein